MKQLFVTLEIAITLNEKGFNDPCFAYYNSHNEFMYFADVKNCNTNSEFGFYPTVPTYQQVIDWFDLKGIIMEFDFTDNQSEYGFQFSLSERGKYTDYVDEDMTHQCKKHYFFNQYFNTRYEALNKAIEEALKLI